LELGYSALSRSDTPPRLLPGPSAQQLLSRSWWYGLATAPIVLGLAPGPLLPAPLHLIDILVFGGAAFFCSIRAFFSITKAFIVLRAEYRTGYTTLPSYVSPRLWLLDGRSGAVLRPPKVPQAPERTRDS
jgi:hypothetical protein